MVDDFLNRDSKRSLAKQLRDRFRSLRCWVNPHVLPMLENGTRGRFCLMCGRQVGDKPKPPSSTDGIHVRGNEPPEGLVGA